MSNDHAADRAGVSEPSTRTVTSGSARQRARTRSAMSCGTSSGALTRVPPAYRRNAARTAAAVELKYPGGSMKPHSLNATPPARARR